VHVALLRGINLGAKRRMAMGDLRRLLEGLGYTDVRTHLQSGNAVFRTPTRSAGAVGAAIERAIRTELGMDVDVVVRTAAQLAHVLAQDPFDGRATDHSRYLAVFCAKPVPPAMVADLDPARQAPEEVAVVGSEAYLWLPDGVQDSRLARSMTDERLGGTWTMRNWKTVRKLAEMAAG